jgi:hypothetical protein
MQGLQRCNLRRLIEGLILVFSIEIDRGNLLRDSRTNSVRNRVRDWSRDLLRDTVRELCSDWLRD